MDRYERYGSYAEEERSRNNAAPVVAGILIGVGVGALISLLFAPQSGQETREFLRQKYGEAVRGVGRQAGNLRSRGAGLMESTRSKVMPFTRKRQQAKQGQA